MQSVTILNPNPFPAMIRDQNILFKVRSFKLFLVHGIRQREILLSYNSMKNVEGKKLRPQNKFDMIQTPFGSSYYLKN